MRHKWIKSSLVTIPIGRRGRAIASSLGQHFQSVVMVPACPLLLGGDANLHGGLAAQPLQRKRSNAGEIRRTFHCACAVHIRPHGDIQHPMPQVFNLPMRANHPPEALRIVVRGAGERAGLIPSVSTCLVRYLLCRFHQHPWCHTRPTLTRTQAVKGLCTLCLAGLEASVPPIHLGVIAQHHLLIHRVGTSAPLGQLVALPVPTRLLRLQTQHGLPPVVHHLPRDLNLATHGINRDLTPVQVQQR
jgi:hypothetical protein